MIFYWTDDQFNKYEDGVISSYAPPGGPPSGFATAVALFCPVPDADFAVFGVTVRVGGTTDALGWRVTDDLIETNAFWIPENGVGDWTLPDASVVEGYFISAYEGVGATFDAVTGYIFLTGIWRRFDMPGYMNQREHVILVIDPATDSIIDSGVLSFDGTTYQPSGLGSTADGGQCAVGRKLYYSAENNADSIVEYDMDDGSTRKSTNCFDAGRVGDILARPGDSTGLWMIDDSGWDSPYDVFLRRFEIADIPWGSSGTAAVPSDEIVLFRDDFDGLLASHVNVGTFITADEIIYQCELVDSGNLVFVRQTINPLGDPEVLVDIGADRSEAYQVFVVSPVVSPNLAGFLRAGSRSFDP